MEIWEDIEGFEGLYQVSNCGNVKSLKKGRLLVGKDNGSGYLKVALYKNGVRKQFYIHRLVAEAFIPNPENLEIVNHINANKQFNWEINLEWVTPKGNAQHAIENDLMVHHIKVTLVDLDTLKTHGFTSQAIASRFLNRDDSYISKRRQRGKDTVEHENGKKYRLMVERREKHDERRNCGVGASYSEN